MFQGWVCPKCSRVFAPWIDECPYCPESTGNSNLKTEVTYIREMMVNPQTGGPCPFVCWNKTSSGYCRSTVCINSNMSKSVVTS